MYYIYIYTYTSMTRDSQYIFSFLLDLCWFRILQKTSKLSKGVREVPFGQRAQQEQHAGRYKAHAVSEILTSAKCQVQNPNMTIRNPCVAWRHGE